MKTNFLLLILALGLILNAFSQNTIELTFTAIDSAAYVQLDSIKVMNRTQGGDTVLYYPDTMLVLDYQVGITETNNREGFQVFQNYPNPVADQTTITMFIPEKDKVSIIIMDMLGRVVIKTNRLLNKGVQSFRFTPGGGNLYFFTTQWRENSSTIKILQTDSHSFGQSSLKYVGSEVLTTQLKATENIQGFSFNLGDELLYIGYADTLQSGMLDTPETSEVYTFQFATNIPCPGTPTVEYEGQVYNTIQIFSQCWLKENLNVGTMIPGASVMTDNDTIEKYCYDNEPDSCTKYGGLYLWDEMMQYITQQGVQGICPQGWHLPSDEEWITLEMNIGMSQSEANGTGWRGTDEGKKLKSTSGWNSNGNGTDAVGFSALPGGDRLTNGSFNGLGRYGYWWSATASGSASAWFRYLSYDIDKVYRYDDGYKDYGFSVRCLRD